MRTLGADLGATVLNQDIYEISATQKHRLGTRVVIGDRVFRYAKAGGTLNTDVAAWTYNPQIITFAAAGTAYPVGSNILKMTVASGDGPAADGVLAAHYMEGGYIVVFSDSVDTFLMAIRDNTAVASGGGTTTLTLDGEIPVAVSATTSYIEGISSPYVDVRTGNNGGYRPFVGAAMRALTTTYPYGWIQTWGPSWLAPQATLGVAAHANQAVFRHDGSVQLQTDEDSYAQYQQHAGFVMGRVVANTQGAPFLFLQVAP